MHRSYNSYYPVASKLLQKRWDDKHYTDHRRHVRILSRSFISNFISYGILIFFFKLKVDSAKPGIDAAPPETFMHLHLKLKKLQVFFYLDLDYLVFRITISVVWKAWRRAFGHNRTRQSHLVGEDVAHNAHTRPSGQSKRCQSEKSK